MGRRRFQKGSIVLRGDVWYGRYWQDVIECDVRKRKYTCVRLGTKADLPTRRLAQRALEPHLADVNSPLYTARHVILFRSFAERWARSVLPNLKPSTASNYRTILSRHLLPYFGDMRMHEITPEQVQQFVSSLERTPKTVRNIVMALRSMWRTAEDWGYVTHDVCRRVQLPKLAPAPGRPFLSAEQIHAVIASAEEPYRTLYWLAAETGLRAGELCGLTWDNIDVDGRNVCVRQAAWRGKLQPPKSAGSVRVVGISGRLAAHLAGMRRERESDGDSPQLLFQTGHETPLDPNLIVKRKLQPLLERLGLPKAGLHAFRHANASIAHRMGVPLKVVQQRLGHATPQLTFDVYTHADSADERRFVEELGESFGGKYAGKSNDAVGNLGAAAVMRGAQQGQVQSGALSDYGESLSGPGDAGAA